MTFNKIAKYPKVLDLNAYSARQRTDTLYEIYERDIFNNDGLRWRDSEVRPTKSNSDIATKDTCFMHLTHKSSTDENGVKSRDSFDVHRSSRIHWIKTHISTKINGVLVFDVIDRVKGRNMLRTYIYNEKEKYVVILEPKRKDDSYYYLLTAYYLDEKYGSKQIMQKYKKREII